MFCKSKINDLLFKFLLKMNLLEYSVLLWYRNLPKLSGDFLNFNFFNFKYWITKRCQSASNIHQPNCSRNRSLHWSSTLFKLIPKYSLSIDFPQKIYFVIYSTHNPKILVVVLSVFEIVFLCGGSSCWTSLLNHISYEL